MWAKKAVLIVDDEFIILESLKIQLERILDKDVIFELASSGEEANAIIDELYINQINLLLVISDFNLDDCKGTDVLSYCNGKYSNSKKIILSGQLDIDKITHFRESIGLHDLFSKPWSFDELRKSICKIPELFNS
jgi:DNA-binding NtrC family response regulator